MGKAAKDIIKGTMKNVMNIAQSGVQQQQNQGGDIQQKKIDQLTKQLQTEKERNTKMMEKLNA